MKNNLQAVLFDLDGVITDTADYHYEAWKWMADRIGISIDRTFNENLKGISRMESLERILVHGGLQNAYTAEEKNRLAQEKNEHYVSLLSSLTPDHTHAGIEELLQDLRAHQIPAVVASASKNAPKILIALGLTEYFRVVVDPEGIPGKPEPDIFLKGAAAVGANPVCCVGIEDATAGILAIKAAGMYAVGIGQVDLLSRAGADIVYSGTEDLTLSALTRCLTSNRSVDA
jgi:beta-phosphoglucomutase